MQEYQQDPHYILYTRTGLEKSNRMFTREIQTVEQTKEPALKRGVTVMVLVPEMSKSMKRFKEEQSEQSALERGVAVTGFIEDIVIAIGSRTLCLKHTILKGSNPTRRGTSALCSDIQLICWQLQRVKE